MRRRLGRYALGIAAVEFLLAAALLIADAKSLAGLALAAWSAMPTLFSALWVWLVSRSVGMGRVGTYAAAGAFLGSSLVFASCLVAGAGMSLNGEWAEGRLLWVVLPIYSLVLGGVGAVGGAVFALLVQGHQSTKR